MFFTFWSGFLSMTTLPPPTTIIAGVSEIRKTYVDFLLYDTEQLCVFKSVIPHVLIRNIWTTTTKLDPWLSFSLRSYNKLYPADPTDCKVEACEDGYSDFWVMLMHAFPRITPRLNNNMFQILKTFYVFTLIILVYLNKKFVTPRDRQRC